MISELIRPYVVLPLIKFEASEAGHKWTSFTGPQGGKGWQNESGDVIYQDEQPGTEEGAAKEQPADQPQQEQNSPEERKAAVEEVTSQLDEQDIPEVDKQRLKDTVSKMTPEQLDKVTEKSGKSLSDKAFNLVAGAKKAAGVVGQKVWNSLPKPAQKALSGLGWLVHKAEAPLKKFNKLGRDIAQQVAKDQGYSDKHVERVGKILGFIEGTGYWTGGYALATHAVLEVALHSMGPAGFVAAKAGLYVPFASLAYIAGSAATHVAKGKNPISLIYNATKTVLSKKQQPVKHHYQFENNEDIADRLFTTFEQLPEDQHDWFEALFAAALDETEGDANEAWHLAMRGMSDPEPQDDTEWLEAMNAIEPSPTDKIVERLQQQDIPEDVLNQLIEKVNTMSPEQLEQLMELSPDDDPDEKAMLIAEIVADTFPDKVKFDWSAYTGPKGGKGWKNDETGKVVYGPNKPGTKKAKADDATTAKKPKAQEEGTKKKAPKAAVEKKPKAPAKPKAPKKPKVTVDEVNALIKEVHGGKQVPPEELIQKLSGLTVKQLTEVKHKHAIFVPTGSLKAKLVSKIAEKVKPKLLSSYVPPHTQSPDYIDLEDEDYAPLLPEDTGGTPSKSKNGKLPSKIDDHIFASTFHQSIAKELKGNTPIDAIVKGKAASIAKKLGKPTYEVSSALQKMHDELKAKAEAGFDDLVAPLFSKNGAKPKANKVAPNESRPDLTKQEQVAVQTYTDGSYRRINDALRDGKDVPPEFKKTHDNLQKAFAKVKTFSEPVEVHRGLRLSGSSLHEFIDAMKASKEKGVGIQVPGYSSTSTGGLVPTFDGNVHLKIKAVEGLDVKPYTHYPHESELLLNHNSSFVVDSIEEKNGRYIVNMRQLPQNSAAAASSIKPKKKEPSYWNPAKIPEPVYLGDQGVKPTKATPKPEVKKPVEPAPKAEEPKKPPTVLGSLGNWFKSAGKLFGTGGAK